MAYWLERSLDLMRDLVSVDSTASDATTLCVWDEPLLSSLDEIYRTTLRPVLSLDGQSHASLAHAWGKYRAQVSAHLAAHFAHSSTYDPKRGAALLPALPGPCLVPLLTPTFLADFNALWAAVDPALREVARWFEPFVDYGPDCHRAQPFHDASVVVARHVRTDRTLADPEGALEQIWTFLRCKRGSALTALSAAMARAAAAHAAQRAETLLSFDTRWPDVDWHIAAQSMRVLCGAFVPARLLRASLELRALEATLWAWKDCGGGGGGGGGESDGDAANAVWAARMSFALQEADVVRAYRERLVRVPHVALLRRTLLRCCQRSDFWDGLGPAEDVPLAFMA
ncbi:hypothetical protein DENSPDRAFT_502718 [Dentipellis sp. KUC8613]|nr:hypothetical protein DENSPDRAFT_502718 [Dentipellis sp. KUC8613]